MAESEQLQLLALLENSMQDLIVIVKIMKIFIEGIKRSVEERTGK